MAVTSKLLVYADAEITAQDFAIMMSKAMPSESGRIAGCGVTKKSTATIHVAGGWVIVKGRLIRIKAGDLAVTKPSSGTVTRYVYVSVDLANTSSPCKVSITNKTYTSDKLFNTSYGKAYLKLASFKIDTKGAITNISNLSIMSCKNETLKKTTYTNAKYKITKASKEGSCEIHLYRRNNIVQMYMLLTGQVNYTSASKKADYTHSYTIPSGYRPVYKTVSEGLACNDYDFKKNNSLMATVSTAGKIALRINTTDKLTWRVSATWITNDAMPS